jgi:hypothetical protein
MLALASLPLKTAVTGKDKATSALARMLTRETSLSVLGGGSRGRRLALADRRLATRWTSMAVWGAACLVAGAGLVS